MYLRCTKQVNAGYIVHFLAMYLQCTGSVHHPLPPVVVPSTEERGGEHTSLNLSDGPRTSIKTIGVARMVAGDTRVHFW